MSASGTTLKQDVEVIGLVGTAHLLSHFFQLLIPPLFPLIKDELGVGYAALGFMFTVMYTVSGVLQTAAGFLVDRFGARRVLLAGMTVYSLAIMLAGFTHSYSMLVLAGALAGAGNSVFHPADFAILNARVGQQRLGHAYSVHGVGGNIGWLLAPLFSIGLSTLFDWRTALICGGALGLVVTGLLATRRVLSVPQETGFARKDKSASLAADLRLLTTRPILLCFGFFAFYGSGLLGLQMFSVSVTTMLYDAPLVLASAALSGFLFGGLIGTIAGGFMAAHSTRHDFVTEGGLLAGAALTLLIASGLLPLSLLVATMTLIGFCTFATQPSRDILVRASAPPGATGKVYGFVYSGLDAGGAVAPLLFGILLDWQQPQLVLVASAAFFVLGVLSVVALRYRPKAQLQGAD